MSKVAAFLHWLCFPRRFVALAAYRLQNPTSRTGGSISQNCKSINAGVDYQGFAIRVTVGQSAKISVDLSKQFNINDFNKKQWCLESIHGLTLTVHVSWGFKMAL